MVMEGLARSVQQVGGSASRMTIGQVSATTPQGQFCRSEHDQRILMGTGGGLGEQLNDSRTPCRVGRHPLQPMGRRRFLPSTRRPALALANSPASELCVRHARETAQPVRGGKRMDGHGDHDDRRPGQK